MLRYLHLYNIFAYFAYAYMGHPDFELDSGGVVCLTLT